MKILPLKNDDFGATGNKYQGGRDYNALKKFTEVSLLFIITNIN